jgi:hypothetical protein
VSVQFTRLVNKRGAVTGIVIQFKDVLSSTGAMNLMNDRIVTAGRDRKLGTRDDIKVKLRSAVYDPNKKMVTLTPSSRLVLNQTGRLNITARCLLDPFGRPLDGDRDGQPGGDFSANLTRKGIRSQ